MWQKKNEQFFYVWVQQAIIDSISIMPVTSHEMSAI